MWGLQGRCTIAYAKYDRAPVRNREQGVFTCKVGTVSEEGVEWRVPVFLFACDMSERWRDAFFLTETAIKLFLMFVIWLTLLFWGQLRNPVFGPSKQAEFRMTWCSENQWLNLSLHICVSRSPLLQQWAVNADVMLGECRQSLSMISVMPNTHSQVRTLQWQLSSSWVPSLLFNNWHWVIFLLF